MFHTGFQSSVQLMLITTVFLFCLNSERVCELSLLLCLSPPSSSYTLLPLFLSAPSSSSISAVSHCVSSCYDYITLSVFCVHLDSKLITADNLVVLFPKFRHLSSEDFHKYTCTYMYIYIYVHIWGVRWSGSSMLWYLHL